MDRITIRDDANNSVLLQAERLLMRNDYFFCELPGRSDLTNWLLPTDAQDKFDFRFPLETKHRLHEELSQFSLASTFQDDDGDHSCMALINPTPTALTRPYSHTPAKAIDSFRVICPSPLNDCQLHTSHSLDKDELAFSMAIEHRLQGFSPEEPSEFSLSSMFQDDDDDDHSCLMIHPAPITRPDNHTTVKALDASYVICPSPLENCQVRTNHSSDKKNLIFSLDIEHPAEDFLPEELSQFAPESTFRDDCGQSCMSVISPESFGRSSMKKNTDSMQFENSPDTKTIDEFENYQLFQQQPEADDDKVDADKNDEQNDFNNRRPQSIQSEIRDNRCNELIQFRKRFGHCRVPYGYAEDPTLARWVKRQRYQYKQRLEGKQSYMTDERIQTLENIGFVWDSQESAWWDKFADLVEFKCMHSHCNVPSRYIANPQLSIWVKCQRRHYRLFKEGKPTNITPQRIRELESIGFQWMIRSYHKVTKKTRSRKD